MSAPATDRAGGARPVETRRTREGFGQALVELGERDPRVVVLVGDLSESTAVNLFAQRFPERFFEIGIAEQNMTGIAAGLAASGKVPFLSTYGAFASCRAADQIRVTVAYSNLNVKIGGAHGGISVGPDGATHQAMEELAILRAMPNLRLVVPCDYWETRKATVAAAQVTGPVYIRFGREAVPVVTGPETPFELGRGLTLREGADVAVIACGVMVHEALCAAGALAARGIQARVINLHTLKPLDEELLARAARECGAVVTAEEHQVHGGLGSAVAQVLACRHPVPMEMVAVMDRFGRSGKPEELMRAFGIKDVNIVEAVERVLQRKRGAPPQGGAAGAVREARSRSPRGTGGRQGSRS
ncbi:MAG TPA: transketolase C-terminal domain-containing protein [Candidatus Saccharimonadales bacterium]|nr:transketolase C-terminal domain-containing protein [Candidatus Saccharimonadales bacterium]